MAEVKVLALVGSLRAASLNRKIAELAVEVAPDGVAVTVFEGLADLPFYNEEIDDVMNTDAPALAAVDALRAAAADAEAALVVTPEYNGSYPAVVKNAIDWLSRPPLDKVLAGKPVAIVGAGGRLGSARAQYHLRQVCACLSMLAVPRPELFVLNAWEKFDEQGRLKDELLATQVGELLTALADWTRLLRKARESA